jgi:lysozyme
MTNLSLKTGPKGLALVREFEGCELKAYRDAVGIWTIGYGHTAAAGPPVPKAGMTISATEAEEILKRDLGKYEKTVLDAVRVPLSQEQFDALVSFTFNVGPGNFRSSTLLKRLNSGNYVDVPNQLKRWNKAGGRVLRGLTRRREAEAFLWSTGAVPAATPPPPDIEPIPEQPKTVLSWLRSKF